MDSHKLEAKRLMVKAMRLIVDTVGDSPAPDSTYMDDIDALTYGACLGIMSMAKDASAEVIVASVNAAVITAFVLGQRAGRLEALVGD